VSRLEISPEQIDDVIAATVRVVRKHYRERGKRLTKSVTQELIPTVIAETVAALMKVYSRVDISRSNFH
jgi:hypothetical protein